MSNNSEDQEPDWQPSDEELRMAQEAEAEMVEAEAIGLIDKFLEELKSTREETLKENKNQVLRISYTLSRFDNVFFAYVKNKKTFLGFKTAEIVDSLYDSFALSVFGRYNTAFFLMRKALELFALSLYFDSQKTDVDDIKGWLFESEKPEVGIRKSIKNIDNNKEELLALYDFLCKFAHNEGTKEYHFIMGHDKNAFEKYAENMELLLDRLTSTLNSLNKF